ncbi:Domain of unknown function (DUF1985 [Striga hermonthica]|uniref:DUF1985 domain-containing protein n=1 Tax=Striga hermonthica TaxID=68872 RepID=A0A9N7RQ28_STRHE|nr:Domain of unknown function (DUF1985 [Striga hermonthica]
MTRKERDEANRLKKKRRDNNDVTKPPRDLQNRITYNEWELLIPHPRNINVKVQNSNDNSKDRSTLNEIKKTLTKEQLEIFRRSAFGKFLDLPQCIIQNQLINYILLCEVHQSRTDELWFNFRGKFLRFGIEEFAVVTGLKCTGQSKKLNIPKISDGLHDKYFKGVDLTRNHIRWQFQKKSWASDEDAVKLAKLHLLANFFMGSQDALRIECCYVDMIDSAECDDYSWGTDIFEFTLHYLKKSIHTREQMHIFEKPEGAGYLYRCYGLILALHTWFYEVCEPAQGVLSTNVSVHDIPRILKWDVRDIYTRIFMERTFSNLHYSKFKNIIPTEAERHILLLNSFFKNKNEFTQNEIPSTDTPRHTNGVDVITRLDTITAELESLKQSFLEFSRRVFAGFEFFKEKLLGGSSKDHHTDRGNTSDVRDGNEVRNELPGHSSAEKETPLQNASDVNDETTSVKSPVRAFRTKSEALMKRAADKPLQKASDVNVENTTVKSPLRAYRTKAEALMKSATDKRSFDDEPHPIYGYALNGSQPSFDVVMVVLPPTPPSNKAIQSTHNNPAPVEENVAKEKDCDVVVVHVPKIEAVKPTSNPKKKSKKETGPKKKVRLFRSCPFDVAFDIVVSGKVDMKNYKDWTAEGLLRTAPRKVDNGS